MIACLLDEHGCCLLREENPRAGIIAKGFFSLVDYINIFGEGACPPEEPLPTERERKEMVILDRNKVKEHITGLPKGRTQ